MTYRVDTGGSYFELTIEEERLVIYSGEYGADVVFTHDLDIEAINDLLEVLHIAKQKISGGGHNLYETIITN